MCERTETSIAHLQMWVDDLRKTIASIEEHGTEFENGYSKFCLVKQKLELELEIKSLKESKCTTK